MWEGNRERREKQKRLPSTLVLELVLGDALAHGSCGSNTTGDDFHDFIDIGGTGPLLVLENINVVCAFLALYIVDVAEHALLLVGTGKGGYLCVVNRAVSRSKEKFNLFFLTCCQGVGVETTQGDELPDKSELAELANESLDVVISQASSVPKEIRYEKDLVRCM